MGRRLALAAAATVLSVALLEVGLRTTGLAVHDFAHEQAKYASLLVWDDAGGYFRHLAGTSAVVGGVTLRFNSLGMRDREPVVPKPDGTFRILCLGDSVTLGPGVPEDVAYPGRLRTMLAGQGIDVVAAAVQGWNTEQEERFLRATIARLAPDLVVLLYVLNDIEPTARMRAAYAPATGWPARVYRQLVLRSRLFEWGAFIWTARFAERDWAGLERMASWRRLREQQGPPFAPDDPGWRESRTALARIHELTESRGARLAIFLHDLGNPPLAPVALERLREFGGEAGVPVLDTAGYFAGRDPAALVNRALVDPHPNAEGHALLAGGVARSLRDAGLLPGAAGSGDQAA